MGDAQLRERLHERRRSELRPVIGGHNEIVFSLSRKIYFSASKAAFTRTGLGAKKLTAQGMV
jgi:hypothetical protein